MTLAGQVALAHPYASGITNNGGTIQFIMNEAGATVSVTFEDASTISLGVLAKGINGFALGAHSSYSISCTKTGNGTPVLISTDTDRFSVWNSPRGVDVNKNPKLGYLFGRTYVGNNIAGGTAPNNKGVGLYALNADLSDSPLGHGATAWGGAIFSGSVASGGFAGSGPWRLRVAPDNTIYVGDSSPIHACVWQYAPDLSSSNQVLAIIGRDAAALAGIHGDFFGTPLATGSIATGDLVLWTGDSGMGAPASATLGPGTSPNSFNCLFRYDIGAGPLPWNQPPNYAYTMGLDGIAELRTEVELGKDGKIIAGFGRSDLSTANIQILDPAGTTVLYNSLHDGADLFNGVRGSGSAAGTYCGVRVSPDGLFLASVDANNGITIATLTNGIPDEGSIFSIPNTPASPNSRDLEQLGFQFRHDLCREPARAGAAGDQRAVECNRSPAVFPAHVSGKRGWRRKIMTVCSAELVAGSGPLR